MKATIVQGTDTPASDFEPYVIEITVETAADQKTITNLRHHNVTFPNQIRQNHHRGSDQADAFHAFQHAVGVAQDKAPSR